MWKGSCLSFFKQQKTTHIFSCIIHWSEFQFVRVMTTMAQVMKEWSSWNKLGWLFVFLVCGCNDVGDGVIFIEERHKKWFIKNVNIKFLLLELERLLDFMFFVFRCSWFVPHWWEECSTCEFFLSNFNLLNFHCVGDAMKGRWI